ncbi:uncharacterized protein LOC115799297 [Archocentrus centrarchus]|uniref:uncharacterized protein LOC115799297 n=1 Tax=Archocentrus centrarchus TaxID=63155 RepID=UPI0011E9DB75|nr:uncharacterized protein LOC115799297 [Archocentrus centrarchus]
MGQCLDREEPQSAEFGPPLPIYALSPPPTSANFGPPLPIYTLTPPPTRYLPPLPPPLPTRYLPRPPPPPPPGSSQKVDFFSEHAVKQKKLAGHWKKDDPQVKVDPITAGTKPEEPPVLFEPEVEIKSGKVSYRFKCPGSGLFQCCLTGLVFDMRQEAELVYRIIQWDQSLLQPAHKTPAGPLFDIKGCEAAVRQLHFPHCETEKVSLSDDLISVIHFTDDGMSILEVLKITDTHVIVDVPHLSAFGLVWDLIERFWGIKNPVKGQVLLFLRTIKHPETQKQNLDVFLLPCNIPLQEVKAQHLYSDYIPVPSNCKLIQDQTYTVHCPTAKKIQPEKAEFDVEFGPNYYPTFQIRLALNTSEAPLTVQEQQAEWSGSMTLI